MYEVNQLLSKIRTCLLQSSKLCFAITLFAKQKHKAQNSKLKTLLYHYIVSKTKAQMKERSRQNPNNIQSIDNMWERETRKVKEK
jgi:hypothetical protein